MCGFRFLFAIILSFLICGTNVAEEIIADGNNHYQLLVDRIHEVLEEKPEKAMVLIEELKNLDGYETELLYGMSSYFKAELWYSESNWGNAATHYQDAIDYFLVLRDSAKLATVYNNLGLVYAIQAHYDKSLAAYSKSLGIELDLDNQLGIAQCYQNMAIVFSSGDHFDRSVEFHKKALEIYFDEKSWENVAATYNNLGTIFSSTQKYDLAIENYEKALDRYKDLNMENYEARVLCNIGALMIREGDFEQAGKYIERGLLIMKTGGDKDGETRAYNLLGDLYAARKDYQQAIFLYEKSHELAVEYQLNELRMNTMFALYNTYKSSDQWRNALNSYERYIELKDTFLEENPEFVQGVLGQELEQRITDRDVLIHQATIRERFFYGALFLISLIAFGGFWLAANRRKRLRCQQEIELLRAKLLKDKVNPTFILTILDSLKDELENGDVEKAISQLNITSALIHLMLENSCQDLIPLSQELKFIDTFYSFQQNRVNCKIVCHVETNLLDNADDILVPSMLTQPFIEHAYRQQNQKANDPTARMNIAFLRRDNMLEVFIEDNCKDIGAYRNLKLAERHKAMGVSFAVVGGKNKVKQSMSYGVVQTEKNPDSEQGHKQSIRFTIPLITQ